MYMIRNVVKHIRKNIEDTIKEFPEDNEAVLKSALAYQIPPQTIP